MGALKRCLRHGPAVTPDPPDPVAYSRPGPPWSRAERNLTFGLTVMVLWGGLALILGPLLALLAAPPPALVATTPSSSTELVVGTVVEVLSGSLTFAFLAAFGVTCAIFAAAAWVRRVPNHRVVLDGLTKPELATVVYDFRVRSRALRAAAAGLFSFLALVTAFGVSSILQQAGRRADYYERLPAQLPALVSLFEDDAGDVTVLLNPEVVRFVSALLEYASYPPWTATIGSLFLVVFPAATARVSLSLHAPLGVVLRRAGRLLPAGWRGRPQVRPRSAATRRFHSGGWVLAAARSLAVLPWGVGCRSQHGCLARIGPDDLDSTPNGCEGCRAV